MPRRRILLACSIVVLGSLAAHAAGETGVAGAIAISRETRPWTRWWWPGSAVDRENITRQLEAFAADGLGGVEITPIYGARGAGDRSIPFLSPRWMEMLEFTAREAQRLGLGVDMVTGTGWPFGGPGVTLDDTSRKITLVDHRLTGAPTNMQVKRAAPGGEGLVLDPYSITAMAHYLAPFTAAFSHFPRGLVRAQFHDSFEYYDASWTSTLPETFRRMHGYDIQKFASALVGQTPLDDDTLRRVKRDYRETLAQLHLDYLRTWADWAHAHGFIVRNQSHGSPGNLLDLYGAVDIPETEIFGSTPFPIPGLRRDSDDVRSDQDLPDSLMIRMASSAAHVSGHPLASSETCTWLREHWKVSLAFAKPEIDRLFTDGINHIIYHGTCYSPADVPWPGWFFYASTQFNPRNPWWPDFAALNRYVTRVQSILQYGTPDNDVLIYWPFDDVIDDPDGLMKQYGVHNIAWLRDSAAGKRATMLSAEGFSCDFISDSQLQQTHVEGGGLATPGHRYRALVVPATRRMPVATLSRLLTLAQGGATVIYESPPEDVPGLGDLEERRAQFREITHAIAMRGSIVGNVRENLVRAGAVRESFPVAGLRYIRRATPAGHDYFLCNLTGRNVNQWITLGVAARSAELLNPLTGHAGGAALRMNATRQTEVFLQLEPGESLLLHTWTTIPPPADKPSWHYTGITGAPFPLRGTWTITFTQGGPELPATIATNQLKSWTEIGDDAAQRFAGTARYRIEFEKPDLAADDWMLDLGDVRESARIRLNDAEIATAWSIPFRVRLGTNLRAGTNTLEIEVTNLAANRIRDLDRRGVAWKIMGDANLLNINYRPFDASAWPLTPSGLLGPVKLVPLHDFDPNATQPASAR